MNGNNKRRDRAAVSYKVDYVIPDFGDLWRPQVVFLPSGIGVAEADVGLALAQFMLTLNVENQRRRKEDTVEMLGRDMFTRDWRKTHQGIAFNRQGKLFDGQNRLSGLLQAAVKDPAVTFPTLVFFGIGAKEEMQVTDTGVNRTDLDAAHVAGVEVTGRDLAILKLMLQESASRRKYSRSEVRTLWDLYSPAVDWVTARLKCNNKLGVSGCRAGFARAYYHCDLARLETFARLLTLDKGANTDVERVAVVLNRFLTSEKIDETADDEPKRRRRATVDRSTRRGSTSYQIRAKVMKCIDCYMNNVAIEKLQTDMYTNRFPVPVNGKRLVA